MNFSFFDSGSISKIRAEEQYMQLLIRKFIDFDNLSEKVIYLNLKGVGQFANTLAACLKGFSSSSLYCISSFGGLHTITFFNVNSE